MYRIFYLILIGIMLFGCSAKNEVYVSEKVHVGNKTYYTNTNIWFERPEQISSVNYHVGKIVPVGTEVKIVESGNNRITFSLFEDFSITLLHSKKHSTITLQELFDRYFSENNPLEQTDQFSQFTQEEQENIKKGEIKEGMSKEAVLLAWGYPPTHRTPSLENNIWVYWVNRMRRIRVYFKDGKIYTTVVLKGLQK
ncbi:MAG: hypothetical protein GY707_01870 [Desulfobacteraceae bacterium]|nr:hypothetical protein [Desulfobacteraceae bacterium]